MASSGEDVDERRRLLVATAPDSGASYGVSTAKSEDFLDIELERARRQQTEGEMANPWPATFERSVMLLARPTAGPALVKFASESMHVLPPTKMKKNTSLTNLNRGWTTPDPAASRRKNRDTDKDGDDDDEGEGIFARMGLKRTPTLDWQVGRSNATSENRSKALEELKLLRAQRFEIDRSAAEAKVTVESKAEADDGAATEGSGKANFHQCVFNMSNMLLGIGILSLPFVFRLCGYLGGSIALFSFGTVTWRTAILIGRMLNGDPRPRHLFDNDEDGGGGKQPIRMRRTIHSFPAIAREAFGQPGAIFLSAAMYMELFSSMVLFLVSIGDHLHVMFPLIPKSRHMLLVAVVLTIPTTLLKTPKLLSYLSAVGTFTTTAVVLSVFTAALLVGDIAEETSEQQSQFGEEPVLPYHTMITMSGLPVGIGLLAFCFSGHAIVPTVYTSMDKPQKFESMMGYSFLVTVTLCSMVGLSGYYMFGTAVLDQITISLERAPIEAEYATALLSWLMITTLFTKFCLYQFPLALAIEEIVAPFVKSDGVMAQCYAAIKTGLIALALILGLFAPGFSRLASLVGLICSMSVSVIFPAAAHLKLFGLKNMSVWSAAVDWFIVIGGTVFATIGTVATLRS